MIDITSHFTPEQETDVSSPEETLIGEGSTSVCYKVRCNGKWYSKKRLKPELKDYQLYQQALRKEYELGSQLDCPYVVHYVDIGEDNQGLFVLADYVDGQSLANFTLQNPDYFKSRRARKRFINELLTAVECLHTHQILHLDLKPSNILITHIGHHVKLIDYGFSYQDSYTDTTGGSPGYSAPEQFSHLYPVGETSDIYAIGSILREFHLASDHVVARCQRENPEERYQSAEELHRVLNSHKRIYLCAAVVMVLLLAACFIYQLTRPAPIPARYSSLRLKIAADSPMRLSTLVLDSTSQPPLVGGMIQNYDSTEVVYKGIFIGPDPDDLFVTDTTKQVMIDDFLRPHITYKNTISFDYGNKNEEEFIRPIRYLMGDQDYYVKAYAILPGRRVIYGKTIKLHTRNFSRFDGAEDAANVFHTSDYTAFDLMTDEIMNIDKDGCYYSCNETPTIYCRNTDVKKTGYYKFKTRWNYQLWYSHWGINNRDWKSYDKGVYRPVMHMKDGKLWIMPDSRNANDTLNFYYTINGDWQRPERFPLKYTAPIKLTRPCIVHCYARRKDGCLSFTNSYKAFISKK